jgi:hypothetical protein
VSRVSNIDPCPVREPCPEHNASLAPCHPPRPRGRGACRGARSWVLLLGSRLPDSGDLEWRASSAVTCTGLPLKPKPPVGSLQGCTKRALRVSNRLTVLSIYYEHTKALKISALLARIRAYSRYRPVPPNSTRVTHTRNERWHATKSGAFQGRPLHVDCPQHPPVVRLCTACSCSSR